MGFSDLNCILLSASASKPAPYTQQDAIKFMNVTVRGLLERPYVERFSWFCPINPSDPIMGFSAVFNVDGSLTEVGKLYASLGVTDFQNPTTSGLKPNTSSRTNGAACVQFLFSIIVSTIVFVTLM